MSPATDAARKALASVEAMLERPPLAGETWEMRAALVGEAAHQLDDLGVDGSSLIRFGLAHLFAAPVLGSVLASVVIEAHGKQLEDDFAFIDLAGWRRALLGPASPAYSLSDVESVLPHANHLVEGWIAYAPFDALVRLAPVEPEQLAEWAATVDSSTRRAADMYRWLVDRTLERDLDRWSTASLKHEYRYVTQGVTPHGPAVLLEAPSPNRDGLAHALAKYVLLEDESRRDTGWSEFMAAVQKQARMLLCEGRCIEAAALFEFLLARYPGDAGLRNNLAFCLITSRPAEAYERLLEAQHMGYEPKSLLLYNRACCATLEAQKRDVLFDANRHWVDGLEKAPVSAFVWRETAEGPVPTNTPDVRRDLAAAAAALALQLGEHERLATWEAREAALRGDGTAFALGEEGADARDGQPTVPQDECAPGT